MRLILPGDHAVRMPLARLGVAARDRAQLLAARPTPDGTPYQWWLLHRVHRRLVAGMGGGGPRLFWPDPPKAGYLPPWVLLAALPDVRRYHRQRGIPDAVSWATLADLGRQMALCRRIFGRGGLAGLGWLALHFRGMLYQLGRLQYERTVVRLDRVRAVFPDADADLPALGVHIPATGPLTPQRCDGSFRRAARFFDRYFPEAGYRHAVCGSWLLDPQLRGYLPASSNIVRFQERFQPVPAGPRAPDDEQVLELVFQRERRPIEPGDLDRLPRGTALQRALVGHLKAGGHWYFRTGWCALDR
jgi:hypothetical protein